MNKCTKEERGHHLYLKCSCGCEIAVDIYYWNQFHFCPNCGTDITEEFNLRMSKYEK